MTIADEEGKLPLHYAAAVRDRNKTTYNQLIKFGADELAQDQVHMPASSSFFKADRIQKQES